MMVVGYDLANTSLADHISMATNNHAIISTNEKEVIAACWNDPGKNQRVSSTTRTCKRSAGVDVHGNNLT